MSGSYKVIVHNKPEIQNVVTDCSKFSGIPILIITLSGGDTMSYKLTGVGGTFNGNVFTSDQLIEGNLYTIEVEDSYQCGVSQWTGTLSCNCDPNFTAQIKEDIGLDCFDSVNGKISVQTSGGLMPLSYLWSNGEKSLSIQNLGPGDYSVTITDSNGCTLEEIYTLKAPPVIQKEQIIIPESCKGLNDGVFELTQLSGGTGNLSSTFNGQVLTAPPFIYNNLAPGNYTVSVTDSKLCKLDFSILIPVGENFNLTLGQDINAKEGDKVQITLAGNLSTLDIITWKSDLNIDCDNCTQFEFEPTSNGYISFLATSKSGCEASDTIFINVKGKSIADRIFIPNSFSPNGDGVNDYFKPYFGDIAIRKSNMNIFNRWGSNIYFEEFTDDAKGWNGRFGGKPLNPDVFVYVMVIEDANGEIYKIKGDVTIYK